METKRALSKAKEYKIKRPPKAQRDCRARVYKDGQLIRYEIGLEHGDAMFVTACLRKLRRNEDLTSASIERFDNLSAYWRDRLKGEAA